MLSSWPGGSVLPTYLCLCCNAGVYRCTLPLCCMPVSCGYRGEELFQLGVHTPLCCRDSTQLQTRGKQRAHPGWKAKQPSWTPVLARVLEAAKSVCHKRRSQRSSVGLCVPSQRAAAVGTPAHQHIKDAWGLQAGLMHDSQLFFCTWPATCPRLSALLAEDVHGRGASGLGVPMLAGQMQFCNCHSEKPLCMSGAKRLC